MTLAEYARRRGVSKMAVSKAVAAGRLVDSIARDPLGRPSIADPDLADAEWERNTAATPSGTLPPPTTLRAPAPLVDPVAQVTARARSVLAPGVDVPDFNVSRAARAAASARRESAQADLAELELAQKRGELVDSEAVVSDVIAAFALVKSRLLAIPSQVAQRLPEHAREVEPVVDALIRAALEELSHRGDSTSAADG